MRHFYGNRVFVASVGVRSGEADPFVSVVMDEIGIDMRRHRPQSFEDLEDANFDLVVSLSPEAHHRALELTRTMAIEAEYWPTQDPSRRERITRADARQLIGRCATGSWVRSGNGSAREARAVYERCRLLWPKALRTLDFARQDDHCPARIRPPAARSRMAKEEMLEFEGMVTELLPNATFRVKLDNSHEIIAHTAGKMRKNRIECLPVTGSWWK